MNFIGRKEELKRLSRAINSEELMLGLIYVRRRVGKSELVSHAISNIEYKSLYYECRQVLPLKK